MHPDTPFTIFGTAHIGALVAVAVAAILVPLLARWLLTKRWQNLGGLVIAAGLLIHEIGKMPIRVYGYSEPLVESLPLHLCGIAALLTAWVLWQRNYAVYEIAYFWGIGGTLPALLTPDLPYGYPHAFYFIFFGGHGLILVGVIYATLVYGLRPRLYSITRTVVASVSLIAVITPINWLLGSNYLYICTKPERATLIDYLGPWPWYVPVMFAIGLVLCLLCYAPFAIWDMVRGEKAESRSNSQYG